MKKESCWEKLSRIFATFAVSLKKPCSKFTVRLWNIVRSLHQYLPNKLLNSLCRSFPFCSSLSGKLSDSSRIFQQVEFQCMFFAISYAMLITFHIQRHHNEANQLSGFRACIDYSQEHSAFLFWNSTIEKLQKNRHRYLKNLVYAVFSWHFY